MKQLHNFKSGNISGEKQVFLSFGDDVNLVFQASILGFV